MSISKRLTKHMTAKELKANAAIFEVVVAVLKEDLDVVDKKVRCESIYEKPAWNEYVADKLGTSRELTKLINIFKVS